MKILTKITRHRNLSCGFMFFILGLLSACSGSENEIENIESIEEPQLNSLDTCTEIDSAYYEELEVLQQCQIDSDCGQSIEGSNCGCTREIPIGVDRDITNFTTLVSLASTYSCSAASLGSDCDCPEADGFKCVEARCEWSYTSGD